MAEITADIVKKLRDATTVSMMECKRALVETNGDIEKATKLLRERGMAVSAKRADKAANQGIIAASTTADGLTGALVEVNCETDFVARNTAFQAFVKKAAEKAIATDGPIADQMKDDLGAQMAAIGENIILRRNVRFICKGNGMVGTYIHMGGKVGVLVEVGCTKPETSASETFKQLVKDLTLHVAACTPRYLVPENIPAAELQSEREIYAKQVTDKPANIVDKIVDGKLKKFFTEICFVEQMFVKEQKVSVKQLLVDTGKALGDTLEIRRYVRYQLGE
jgi:elongation factor Ts